MNNIFVSELLKYRESDPKRKRRTQRIDKISETQCKRFQVLTQPLPQILIN